MPLRAVLTTAMKGGYKDAAWIVMLTTKGSEAETAIGYLHKALGADPTTVRNDSTFSSLQTDARFQEAMRAVPGESAVHASGC